MRKTWAVVLVCTLGAGHAWAVHRCQLAGGQVVYQDAPCPAAAQASQVRIFASPSDPAGRQRAAAEVAEAARLAQRDAVVPSVAGALTAPAAAAGSPELDGMAEACLNLYRPGLRDPRGAYWRDASLDRLGVLHISVHATNGYGGYVAAPVSCDVRAGRVERLRQ